jgi:hypothetical protein
VADAALTIKINCVKQPFHYTKTGGFLLEPWEYKKRETSRLSIAFRAITYTVVARNFNQ